jgi:3-dehydroquinate synthase
MYLMPTVHVDLGPRSYDIRIGSDLHASLDHWFGTHHGSRKALIVTDRHVDPHAKQVQSELKSLGLTPHLMVMPYGEDQKCQASLSKIYDELVNIQADRQTLVVAVGGGVIGDLAGFAAATFNRGLPLFMVPTTLLAMVDSSVGGKVGINHPKGKNLIGAFHQPIGVAIHLPFLKTLPDREFHSGLAEVVKYGMIMDPEFFEWLNDAGTNWRDTALLEHMIETSCRHKATVVQKDEYETKGLRAILNFGHTFAHAIEAVTGYGTLLHGEAVAIGMVAACRLAERLQFSGTLKTDEVFIPLLQRMKLPTEIVPSWPIDALIAAMRHDKKNTHCQLGFVLPRWIGKVETGMVVEESVVREVLANRLSGPDHVQ